MSKDKMNGAGKKKRKLEEIPLSHYVVFSIGLIIIYTIAELILSDVYQMSHDTLTTCFFACFGGEVLSCALIKIFKLRNSDFNGEIPDSFTNAIGFEIPEHEDEDYEDE